MKHIVTAATMRLEETSALKKLKAKKGPNAIKMKNAPKLKAKKGPDAIKRKSHTIKSQQTISATPTARSKAKAKSGPRAARKPVATYTSPVRGTDRGSILVDPKSMFHVDYLIADALGDLEHAGVHSDNADYAAHYKKVRELTRKYLYDLNLLLEDIEDDQSQE